MTFRLLFVSPNHVPVFSNSYLDPEIESHRIIVKKNNLDQLPPELLISGRITDEEGNPIKNAVLERKGVKTSSGYTGSTSIVDSMAVTNSKGEYRFGLEEPCQLEAKISANGFCPQIVKNLNPDQRETIRLNHGVTVQGNVELDGKPLPHVGVGLVQRERGDNYIGYYEIDTDENGIFQFANVPANEKLYFYGLMKSLKPHGCLPSIEIVTGIKGSTLNLKPSIVEPGFTVEGRVVFTDSTAVPKGMRAHISRENAWDVQVVSLDDEGRFRFTGVPKELCSLVANYTGYRKSRKNKSLSPINPFMLIGTVDRNLLGIEVVLEPGKWLSLKDFEPAERRRIDQLRMNPIAGAE